MLSDWEADTSNVQAGGQGTVTKVRHHQSGVLGGLKRLYPEQARRTERRYRFLKEVSALRALSGDGAPRVLEANEADWQDEAGELYLVMEWIEGRPLSQLVQLRTATASEATAAMLRICAVLESCLALDIHHRDLKPDNVVMRGDSWSDPILVDFGISWSQPAKAVEHDFQTPDGQELGNRFLRLPEFAPGGEHYEHRSDVSMAVGLLFFMLTGRAPRVLVDGHGRLPHQAHSDAFPADILGSAEWPNLRRIFAVGFQSRLAARFQTATDLRAQLEWKPDSSMDDVDRELEEQAARLREAFDGEEDRRIAEVLPGVKAAHTAMWDSFNRLLKSNGLMGIGQSPSLFDEGRSSEFYLYVSRQDLRQPYVHVRHAIQIAGEEITASVGYEKKSFVAYYRGPAADYEGLAEATSGQVKRIAAEAMRRLREQRPRSLAGPSPP